MKKDLLLEGLANKHLKNTPFKLIKTADDYEIVKEGEPEPVFILVPKKFYERFKKFEGSKAAEAREYLDKIAKQYNKTLDLD